MSDPAADPRHGALVLVELFDATDLSDLVRATVIIGYGTDPNEMLLNHRNRDIFTVSLPR